MTVRFEIHTESPLDAATLFDRSRSLALHTESMASARETVLSSHSADLLGLGDDVTWRARHFGRWWTMTSRITKLNAPYEFIDEQIKGPFRRFHHTHRFAQRNSGSIMTDLIEFEAPYGPIGTIAEKTVLTRYLRTMLEDRARMLAR